MNRNYSKNQSNDTSALSKIKATVFLVFLVLLSNNYLLAQGNNCSSAPSLTINGTCATGATINNNGEDGPPVASSSCFGGGSNSFRREGWYSFTVTSGPQAITITANSTNRNLCLQLISGTCGGTLTEIQCANANNASDAAQTETITATLANGTYYIKVTNINNSGGNNMNLSSLCVTTACTTPTAQPTSLILSTLTSTSINGSFTAASPAPGGYLVLRSTSSTPPSPGPVNGTTYSAGNTISGATVISTGNSNTFSASTLTSNTLYYFYVYSYNSGCGGAPFYNTALPLTNSAITCPDAPTAPVNTAVTSSACTISWTASVAGGVAATINYTLEVYADAGYTVPISGSPFNVGTALTYSLSGLNGSTTYYYRIKANNGSCDSSYLTNTCQTLCSTPTAQPTTLTLSTITSTSINGSFTAAIPAPSGYLIVRSSSPLPPALTNGTSYAVGLTTLTPGTTRVMQGSVVTSNAVTFSDTGLTSNTKYYYHIFSYNSGCTGAPYYQTIGQLSNNATTCPAAPSTPVNSSVIANSFTVSWTASVIGGGAATINYTLEVYTDAGYTIPISGSPFSVGTAVTYSLNGLNGSSTYYYRIKANNGSCDSSYITGSASTILTNDNCTGAISITPTTACSYTTYTNAGATASASIPAPGCASYSGGDVWFSVVVPSSGKVTINSQAGVMTDGGMAVYTGSCAGLTLLQCDDDSGTGLMPYLNLTGLTAGTTIYIRFWEYGNDNNGTFGLCVTAPTPCTAGNGTGTSSLACPAVVAGGLGLNGAAPPAFNCFATSTCVDLEATYPQYSETTNYTVSSIPYNPPYQFNCLQNAVSVNIDDVWSNTVNLPFNFCFYGTSYNKCLIGSNGTITFDTTNNTAGGYSTWSFSNNLPNNTLFLNTIFGVYHDIDPSKGGQVGWELVTLNSGCRALIAAWSDVPMFSDNSILYTGMMVLYENTNVIEVYIKDKRIDNNNVSPWNGGNAIVGIQDASGSQAIVAPNRNALDTNWTATNEAWRFTPSGNSLTSIKWYQGAGTAGPVVGSSNALNVCPSSTTIYTAEVTYNFCTGTVKQTNQTTVSITGGKTWNGSVSTDWNNANNWTPTGVPTNINCVTIPNVTNKPIISGSGYNAYAYNLSVLGSSSLQLNSLNNITVTDFVKVNAPGTFTVKSSGNLVQINNTAVNTGSITMERTTNIGQLDYVYWSSPVAGFNTSAVSPGTNSWYIYKWDPVASNGNGGLGYWVSGVESMVAGKGYIVRGPDAYGSSPTPFTATFNGVPLNGIIQPTVARGGYTGANYPGTNGATITNLDDNWNLLGNPYPSAINATTFLANNTNIDGNIRIWTHGSPISASNPNPFYGSFIYNYTVNDYVSYNATGSTPPGYNGKIGAGQGFFVVMNDGPATSGTVTFDNSLRSSSYNNSQFYKTTSSASPNEESNRIWLSLIEDNNASATTLVGYVSNATYQKDRLYDAPYKVMPELSIYSLLEDKPMIIQGRPVPFDNNDFVPLGISIPANGIYTLAINQVDGLFEDEGQNIFLEDTYNNMIYDLRQAPYTFMATVGNYADRFILRYTNSALGNPTILNSSASAFVTNHILQVQATENIKKIDVFDVTGKHVTSYNPEASSRSFTDHFPYANGVYIATITMENNRVVSQKLMN